MPLFEIVFSAWHITLLLIASVYGVRSQDVADVTLVTPKDHFEIPYPAVRVLVTPELADKTLVPFNQICPNAKVHTYSFAFGYEQPVLCGYRV